MDIEPIVELVKGEHEKFQNRFNEANVFKEPNDVALWGAVLQEVGAFIGLMINAPTVDAIPVQWIKEWKEEIKDHPAYTEEEKTLCIEEFEDMLGAWAERKEE